MAWIPGSPQLTDKIPELTSPRGFLRAAVVLFGVLFLTFAALLALDARLHPFLALLLQLALYFVAHRILADFFRGRRHMPYHEAFYNRFLVTAGINFGSLLFILANNGGLPYDAEPVRLVPRAIGALLALYLGATGLALAFRAVQAAGVDTLAGLYNYYPDEGRLVKGGIYDILRHPAYAGLDRLALAFAAWNGSAYALVLALIFVFVWHPAWIGLEEAELTERLGDQYAAYRNKVPAVMPADPAAELALLETLARGLPS
jgi:protein-S-isoprenylcysteine O-methyltransferase Ste14